MKDHIFDLFWILSFNLSFVLFLKQQFQVEFFFRFCALAFVSCVVWRMRLSKAHADLANALR